MVIVARLLGLKLQRQLVLTIFRSRTERSRIYEDEIIRISPRNDLKKGQTYLEEIVSHKTCSLSAPASVMSRDSSIICV